MGGKVEEEEWDGGMRKGEGRTRGEGGEGVPVPGFSAPTTTTTITTSPTAAATVVSFTAARLAIHCSAVQAQ